MKKKKYVKIIIAEVSVLLILALTLYVLNTINAKRPKNSTQTSEKENENALATPVEGEENYRRIRYGEDGYTNILLVGLDVRNQSQLDYANSDTMIVASINNNTGKIRMVSIYRDTLLNIDTKDGDAEIEKISQLQIPEEAAPSIEMGDGIETGDGYNDENTYEEDGEYSDRETEDTYEEDYEDEPYVTMGDSERVPEELYEYITGAPWIGRYDKINASYSMGSIDQLKKTIENNLDIRIDGYVVVNFTAVADVVDDLGGINVWMTKQEVIHMNNYCVETSSVTGKDYAPIIPHEEAQEYHLNGIQAVSYARIRYTAGNDMKRTQRQRVVVNKIIEKGKEEALATVEAIVTKVMPNCKTSLSPTDIIAYAANAKYYEIEKTTGFPFYHIEKHCSPNGRTLDPVVPVTLEKNVEKLHEFMYDDVDYTPSPLVRVFSRGVEVVSGLTIDNFDEAEANSVIRDSGGEADVVK